MRFWLGVTDNRWFQFLAKNVFDEVNFWQPSPVPAIQSLEQGAPFLFKLKKPNNHIAGGGFFVRFAKLPLSLAWEVFGQKNGAISLEEFKTLILPLNRKTNSRDPEIGCNVLSTPFFFSKDTWIEAPRDWSGNIVRGKTYDTATSNGAALWHSVADRLQVASNNFDITTSVAENSAQYTEGSLGKIRLGQGAFRILVTEAYERKCAITGEKTLPTLEAAHIKPFANSGPNNTYNGLLLRSDFHKLFDKGYITVTPELHIVISPRIREEWVNGKVYYRLHGNPLAKIPEDIHDQPCRDLLRWHNESIYLD